MDFYYPFDGDGRRTVEPILPMIGTMPMKVTLASARMLIDRFNQTDVSNHSAQGATLWVVIAWCQAHEESFVLKGRANFGYQVTKGTKALWPEGK